MMDDKELLTPIWWWKNIHSGSQAIEAARELLEHPGVLMCEDRTMDVMLICSELIFRVTGEQITPSRGFMVFEQTLHGPMDTCSHDLRGSND